MKLSTRCKIGFIALGLGTAFLLYVNWSQMSTTFRSIYYRENIEKLDLTRLKPQYDNVETFVLFVGYPRSGHSLIAAILDSHPEIIISNEFDLLAKFNSSFMCAFKESNERRHRIFYELHSRSREQAIRGERSPKEQNGYSYNIPGSWQGRYRNQLKVIGDKKGGTTTTRLGGPRGLQDLQELQKTVIVPIKLIHVIRNPYDNIATICLRRLQQRTPNMPNKHYKLRNSTALDFCIEFYFNKSRTVQTLHEMSKYQILDVYSRDMIEKPTETLNKLCSFLNVTCYNEFVELA